MRLQGCLSGYCAVPFGQYGGQAKVKEGWNGKPARADNHSALQ